MCLFTSFPDSNAQTTETTGNIVINTPQGGPSSWTNAVYQDSLTCWAGGQPGYCGPNAIVRPGNNINFSYGSTYIFQQQNPASLLPQQSGLQITGYNFGFTAKNGNGWDDGRVDQLTALVRFWDTTGGRGTSNLLYGKSYDLNYKFNWTTFNFTENFTSPLDANKVGTVQYGFLGRDNNGWAGPYGPEINSISFQLKYRVDPCATNPLYSPSCPGYASAMSSLVPQQATVQTVTIAPTVETVPTVQPVQQVAQTAANTSVVQPVVQPVAQTTTQPAQQQQTQQAAGQPNLQLAMSVISRNQERDKQQQQQAVQLATEVAQQAADRTLATAQQTAQQSQQQSQQQETIVAVATKNVNQQQGAIALQSSTALQTQQQLARPATAIATQDVVQAQFSSLAHIQQNLIVEQQQTTNIAATMQPVFQPPSTVQAVTVVREPVVQQQFNFQSAAQAVVQPVVPVIAPREQPQQVVASIVNTVREPIQQPAIVGAAIVREQSQPASNRPIQTTTQSNQLFELVPQTQIYRPNAQESVLPTQIVTEQPKQQAQVAAIIYKEPELTVQSAQNLLDKTSPISDLFYAQPLQLAGTAQTSVETRRIGQTNELAGGVSLDRMASQPQGYNQYLTLALVDARFYQTREIYTRQTTVDNQRALRQLSSDRLHQEMVNQQYK